MNEWSPAAKGKARGLSKAGNDPVVLLESRLRSLDF